MARAKEKIDHKHLVICEGVDAKYFLIWYFNSSALSDIRPFADDIQIIDFGGNEELSNYLAIVKNTAGFDKLESILIVRDAERDAEAAVSKIQSALRKNEFPVPEGPHIWKEGNPKVGFLLFPTCDAEVENGTLEDLCISILEEPNSPQVLQEIKTFLQVLRDKHGRSYPHEFKTTLHTYFSVTDKYVSLKVGEAAKAGAFNWSSGKLTPLKEFMMEVF